MRGHTRRLRRPERTEAVRMASSSLLTCLPNTKQMKILGRKTCKTLPGYSSDGDDGTEEKVWLMEVLQAHLLGTRKRSSPDCLGTPTENVDIGTDSVTKKRMCVHVVDSDVSHWTFCLSFEAELPPFASGAHSNPCVADI